MTSTFATNFVSSKLRKKHYLETTVEGAPLQGQVPLTYQVYSGNGSETIEYDGSDVVIVTSTLSAGNLTLDCSAMQNWYGRNVELIAYQTLSNNIIIDFGTGDVYSPPSTGSTSTVTILAADTPVVTKWTFVSPTVAVLTHSPSLVPPTQPKTLTFKISTDATNDLNTITATRIQFDSTTGSNDTTLQLDEIAPDLVTSMFAVDPGKYSFSYSIFSVHDPSIALRGFIGVNSDIYCYMESSLGITGQTLQGALTIDLDAGDEVAVYVGNVDGAVTPIVPSTDYYGLLCATQY